MGTFVVVMAFCQFRGKILFLKRNADRKTYANKWQMVTGHIMEKESGEDAALREVKEETGLTGKIVKAGPSFEWEDDVGRFVIVPYIVDVPSDTIKMDPKEHSEYCWLNVKDWKQLDCLPGMEEDLKSVGLI